MFMPKAPRQCYLMAAIVYLKKERKGREAGRSDATQCLDKVYFVSKVK